MDVQHTRWDELGICFAFSSHECTECTVVCAKLSLMFWLLRPSSTIEQFYCNRKAWNLEPKWSCVSTYICSYTCSIPQQNLTSGYISFPLFTCYHAAKVNKILDFIYLPSTHMQDSPWWREVFRHVLLPSLALQEMSPIDIVPMAPQSHEETFHDNTQSDIGYMNHGYGSMDRSGTVPRRPTNGHVKHVSYHMPSQLMWYVRTYVCAYCMYVCTVQTCVRMALWWGGCLVSIALTNFCFYSV